MSVTPPDIKTDKLFVVMGGSLIAVTEPVYTTGPLPAWVTVYPRNPTGPAAECYPKERHLRIMHDVQVGTVDELTELFRANTTRAYHQFALTPPPGEEQPVVPAFGEPSLRRQNEAVAAMCDSPGKAVSIPANAGPDSFADFLAARYTTYGEPRPTQSEFERDRLKRLVASYHNYRFPDAASDSTAPTDNPGKVQQLIDALVTLKRDAEARAAPESSP